MGDALSQSDLDAIFGDSTPAKEEEKTLSQSDLDNLFGDMSPAKETDGKITEIEDALKGLDLSQLNPEPKEDPNAKSSGGSENLSQDDIDALLKEFLG